MSRMTRRIVRCLLVLLAVAQLSACDKKTSTSPTATPSAGNWSGTTSDGQTISFTVSGSTVSSLRIGVRLTGNCGVAAVTSAFQTSQQISGTTFTTGTGGGTNVSGT